MQVVQNVLFYWRSLNGTALAPFQPVSIRAALRGVVGSFAMLFAIGAAASAIDALKSLTSSSSSSQTSQATTGFKQVATTPFDLTGTAAISAGSTPGPSNCPPGNNLSPSTMSALLTAQSQASSSTTTSTSASDALKDLFLKLDGNGDGQVSKSEFENALGAGGTNLAQADDVFSKLDTNGDGQVSLDELSSALKGAGGQGHHHKHAGGANGANTDALLQALDGASSTSTTNSDGSTTTSLTYADGSTVTLTSPAARTASSTATSSYNFIEQAIQREAHAISASATPSLSVSV